MNFFKLLLIFALLLFGTFGQRFLRHSNNNVALIDGKDPDDNLLSFDGSIAQQVDNDVKLTGYIEEIELELKGNELMFEFCSERIAQNRQRCMDKTVYVCYDAETPSVALRGHCRPNQCSFEAGISKPSFGLQTPIMWFMDFTSTAPLDENEDICPTAIMQSPTADVTVLAAPPPSCEPLIIKGKIKLYAIKATPKCFLTVKNAKIWTLTTTHSPTTQASPASEAKGTKEESSNATLIWTIVGVILFFLLILIIALAVWYFCIRKQKKSSEKKNNVAEPPKHTVEADAVKDKSEDKKEPAEPKITKEDTNEKKKAVEKQKKPKAAKKEKKVVQRIQLKPSKEFTQENVTKEVPPTKQASAEPTLDEPTTGASITAQKNEQPQVFVPKNVIHPAPLQPASKGITQYSKSSSRKGSLSGRHEIGIMAESPSESVKRALDTESGMGEESTRASITRASEKHRKKESGGGKKKHSKKRH
uniref:Uncharacterized protein n=1 Tax=Panagrolaimus davidi TaxID=227884 RepID=A0A914PRK9_9BILA